MNDILSSLSRHAGILDSYQDVEGHIRSISRDARRATLAGMGLTSDSDEDARTHLLSLEAAERERMVAPVSVVDAGRSGCEIAFNAPRGVRRVRWYLVLEDGRAFSGEVGTVESAGKVNLPAIPAGYHDITLEAGSHRSAGLIMAAPPRCWLPEEIAAGARIWGLTAQVYGLRSAANLGIGDLTDIADLVDIVADLHGDMVGLSPVHALFAADPGKYSPYAPSSRLFVNTLYLDPRKLDYFAGFGLDDEASLSMVDRARAADLVDYPRIHALKSGLFESAFVSWSKHADQTAFSNYLAEQGEALRSHALFEALSEHFAGQGAPWPGAWPEAYRNPNAPEVAAFAAANEDRIRYHSWLQWQADKQMAEAAGRAASRGMAVGLYKDLAVGADPGGSEVWSYGERYARGVSIGAPPDALAPQGQIWGLPPLNPMALASHGHDIFRRLLRANMRGAGAIRIDHAFQLRRLFWVPEGIPAAESGYVLYPLEELLAVLKIESQRARCMVIAEDLGTVPAGFSEAIMRAGLLSYRLFFFEREADGAFREPHLYPRRSLAAISTHDLPTIAGWWKEHDLDTREAIGISADGERARLERDERERERERVAADLSMREPGLADIAQAEDAAPLAGLTRRLARTTASVAAVQIEDAIGEIEQANVPGTTSEHPNWRRRLSVPLEALRSEASALDELAAIMRSEGRMGRPGRFLAEAPPRATYRLQMHEEFTFDHAATIVPYLAALGVSHVYTSPILTARPGSRHGYDIVEHAAINPELGGEDGLRRFSAELRRHSLGLVVDIVPNHMGVGGADNGWWLSVLEWGQLSPRAGYFDIDWNRDGLDYGKIVLPFLADQYGIVLERGELQARFDAMEGSFSVWHYEHRFPLCPLTYPTILDRAVAALADGPDQTTRRLVAISERLRRMEGETSAERRAAFVDEAEAIKAELAALASDEARVGTAIERALAVVNGAKAVPDSYGALHRLIEAQSYRLAYWRVASTDINYRRFFDINTLAGLRVEEPELFHASHAKTFELVREGVIQGLRIDHIDGLADPESYLHALQREVGPGFYVLAEKILEGDERLRAGWPLAGTTGYETMNLVNGVFVDTGSAGIFDRIYGHFAGEAEPVAERLVAAKAQILEDSLSSELEVLTGEIDRIANSDPRTRDFTYASLRRALGEIVALFPVYRTYVGAAGPADEDRRIVEETVGRAKARSRMPDRTIYDFVGAVLTDDIETDAPGRPEPASCASFRSRFQQLTGPVMAKGLEDTLFYRHVPLLSLNEVGGHPGSFGVPLDQFDAVNTQRARDWPHQLNASATHDMKRGEDARARLNVLSELPADWSAEAGRWRRIALKRSPSLSEGRPDGNDLYLLFQTLVATWPLEAIEQPRPQELRAFRTRIEAYLVKALREAKRHTSWMNVDEGYEQAMLDVAGRLLDTSRRNRFFGAAVPFIRRVAHFGMINALAQTVLKCTIPGVPDIYQGTESWDLSLVDPDNRRPVDYASRSRALAERRPLPDLLDDWQSGEVKIALIHRLLTHSRNHPDLYSRGTYRRIAQEGSLAGSLVAFERRHGEERLVSVVPRLVARRLEAGKFPLGSKFWADTDLKGLAAGRWRDILTDRTMSVDDTGALAVGDILAVFPAAVLKLER